MSVELFLGARTRCRRLSHWRKGLPVTTNHRCLLGEEWATWAPLPSNCYCPYAGGEEQGLRSPSTTLCWGLIGSTTYRFQVIITPLMLKRARAYLAGRALSHQGIKSAVDEPTGAFHIHPGTQKSPMHHFRPRTEILHSGIQVVLFPGFAMIYGEHAFLF